MLLGQVTPEASLRYASRFGDFKAAGFYRDSGGVQISSLGIGTYLGGLDQKTTDSYVEALMTALRGGVNFVDTSLNYRHQRSEQAVGQAVLRLVDAGEVDRDAIMVCSKAGYLVPGAIPRHGLEETHIVGGMHSIAPAFLSHQLDRSRENLGLETVDVFYLHNPETQLEFVARATFEDRIRAAFELCESLAARKRIQYYGTATWNGYRQPDALSVVRLAQIAREVAGERHRFRFIQLPFNLAMPEPLLQTTETLDGERLSVLEAAGRLGIAVIASATLLQARLARGLPAELAARMPGAPSDAVRAIQFVRSTPGISVALVGMSRRAHVEENLLTARFQPLAPSEFPDLLAVAK
ncbi:MAG: aldo/keto reductase [Acidobacteria bacterium]|nr:aldo/keto reductase [Acidobacteriota bacterium]MBI3280974.1 aldo/keto reductase [Acidobacteriota bacterium]